MLYPTRLSYTLNTEPQWRCDERHTKAITLLLNRCGTHETTLGSWMNDAIYGCSVTQRRAVQLERDIPCIQGVNATVVSSRQQQRNVCEASVLSVHMQTGPAIFTASSCRLIGSHGEEPVVPLSAMTGITLVGMDKVRTRLSSGSRRTGRPLRHRWKMHTSFSTSAATQ